MNCIGVGSNERVTIVDDYVRPCVKSNTIKLSPFQDDDDINPKNVYNTPDLDITIILVIAPLRSSLNFSEESITSDVIQIVINSITLQTITPAEQALGKFTHRKLENMDTWDN